MVSQDRDHCDPSIQTFFKAYLLQSNHGFDYLQFHFREVSHHLDTVHLQNKYAITIFLFVSSASRMRETFPQRGRDSSEAGEGMLQNRSSSGNKTAD